MSDELQAGHETDKLIAERVTHVEPYVTWEILNPDETASAVSFSSRHIAESYLADKLQRFPDSWLKDYHVGEWKRYPRYSSDISAAWQVVERMRLHYQRELRLQDFQGVTMHVWSVRFQLPGEGVRDELNAQAETAPLAICRAALKVAAASQESTK